MTATIENRQHLSGNNEEERLARKRDTDQLVHDLIGRHEEYFADPGNRLDFIRDQEADGMYAILQHVNAKLRSERPYELRRGEEHGGFLPFLHTPSNEDKRAAFGRGYDAIHEYIETSADSIDKKIEGVAMGVEALTVWVHPFKDGNGRTSRFLAKFIEDGGADKSALRTETADGRMRPMVYTQKVATKEGLIEDADNDEVLLDDDERDELRAQAEHAPTDVEGMYLSVKQLLEDDDKRAYANHYRQRTLAA